MNNFSIIILSFVTVIVNAQNDQIEVIKQADKNLNEVITRHQHEKAAGIYVDNFVLTTSSGKVKTKSDMLKEISLESLQLEINETDQIEVSVEGTTAVLRGRLHQKGTYNGKTFDAFLLVTDTWVRTADGWKLLAGHASLLPNSN